MRRVGWLHRHLRRPLRWIRRVRQKKEVLHLRAVTSLQVGQRSVQGFVRFLPDQEGLVQQRHGLLLQGLQREEQLLSGDPRLHLLLREFGRGFGV